MTHPPDQQTGSSNVGGDHNHTITTGDITGNSGPIAIGWNIVQKIWHVEVPIDEKSRQRLIAQVREFWVEGVLGKSLYREAWSALGLYADPKAITYAGQLASVKGEREPQPLPADVSIDRVFDDAQQHLLILGAPGGGKTTLLLELAQVLLARAEHDKEQAIPVVFNLSSWAQQRLPLEKWLVQELRTNYGVGKQLAQQWVRKNAILPLLDGLDEVTEPQRADCASAINSYCAEHGPEGIVVCSRIADYRAMGAKLELNEAVVVQPLTDTQIANYLDRAGEPMEGVRAVLAQDTELQQLVRVPLMLNIVSLAYQGERPEELRDVPPAEQRHRLFDRYVERMLERPRKPDQLAADTPPYSHDKTRHWLSWLAKRLHENNQTVFQMELMQPIWLQSREQSWLYTFLTGFCGMMVAGILIGIFYGLLFSMLYEPLIGLFVGLGFGIFLGGFVVLYLGIIIRTNKPKIVPVQSWQWSWKQQRDNLLLLLIFGFLVGGGIGSGIEFFFGLPGGIISILNFALATMLILTVTNILLQGLQHENVTTTIHPNEGMHRSTQTALLVAPVGGLIFGIILAWLSFPLVILFSDIPEQGWSIYLFLTTTTSILLWMYILGIFTVIKHVSLRLVLISYSLTPWRYARFLDYAAERILLRRVGGSYIFVHRMLLEYFANLEQEKIQT